MTETPVVVVTGATADEPPPGIDAVEALATLRYAADGVAAGAIDGADAVFAWWRGKEILEEAWDRAGSLRWIQCASDGVDGMLFPALVESDVEVTNARGVFDAPIAEWAIAAILAFRTGLHRSIVDTTRRRWDDDRSRRPVEGSHLVVVGPGPIGRVAARRARDLGMTVTMVGRAPRRDAELGPIVGPEGFHEALAAADHVLDALPLAAGTRRLFDAAAFDAMKPGAVFVNVGRGGTVDEPALLDALGRGHVAGAALDVFDDEPIPEASPFWDLEHVIVSPHICGDVEGWEAAVVGVFVDNLRRFARGEPLRNLVDKRAGFGLG